MIAYSRLVGLVREAFLDAKMIFGAGISEMGIVIKRRPVIPTVDSILDGRVSYVGCDVFDVACRTERRHDVILTLNPKVSYRTISFTGRWLAASLCKMTRVPPLLREKTGGGRRPTGVPLVLRDVAIWVHT